MIKGLYSAASGMVNLLQKNDTLANNLANINTPGFKKSVTLFKAFAPLLIDKISAQGSEKNDGAVRLGQMSSGCTVASVNVDFSQGQLRQTNNNYDIALQGDGFFEVENENGQRLYTRNGSFDLSADGYLVTRDGNKVIGEDNKPVMLGNDLFDFQVNRDGTVLENNEIYGKLKIVSFENNHALSKVGDCNFVDNGLAGLQLAKNVTVVQGALESSNANVIKTMVKTIEGMRAYETLAKIVEKTNNNLEKATGQVGKV